MYLTIYPIRNFSEENLGKDVLFQPRKALQYTPMIGGTSSDGSVTDKKNPDYGATISYFIKDAFTSLTAQRIKKENVAA